MIIYFSATGNNKYVAEQLAEAAIDYDHGLRNGQYVNQNVVLDD